MTTNVIPLNTPTLRQKNHAISGIVHSKQDGVWQVSVNHKLISANLAASCWLQPQVGDTVQMTLLSQRYLITAVLISANPTLLQWRIPQDLLIQADGQIQIQCQQLNQTVKVLLQKIDIQHKQIEKLYQLKAQMVDEQVMGLKRTKAAVQLQQAEQVGITAKKVLINS